VKFSFQTTQNKFGKQKATRAKLKIGKAESKNNYRHGKTKLKF
jgi:hypothetical protein